MRSRRISRSRRSIATFGALLLGLSGHLALAGTCAFTNPTASSAIAGSSAAYATDGNPATAWQSVRHLFGRDEEWIEVTLAAGSDPVQAISFTARFQNGKAQGFPKDFTTAANGAAVRNDDAFPTTSISAPVVLLLETPVTAGQTVRITSRLMTPVGLLQFGFDLAEIAPVCDSRLDHLQYAGNDGTANRVLVENAGAGPFDPAKLVNFVRDVRQPLIAADTGAYRNIYAANPHKTDDGWNIYFGGWDGLPLSQLRDQVYMTTTTDWSSFTAHQLIVDAAGFENGSVRAVNNPTAVRVGDDWYALVTTNPGCADPPSCSGLNAKGKTGVITSTNGTTWTPNPFVPSSFITMTGYDGSVCAQTTYANSNVNSSKAVWFDGTVYHMLFEDIDSTNTCGAVNLVHYATSTNGHDYTYIGQADDSTGCKLSQDLRKFTVAGGSTKYMMVYICNTNVIRYALSDTLGSWPAPSALFTGNTDDHERQIASAGLVTNAATDNTVLYGVLFGSSNQIIDLDLEIYGIWLQKKIELRDATDTPIDTDNGALGPDQSVLNLPTGTSLLDASVTVLDTDASTVLLPNTPLLTLRAGDQLVYQD